LSVFIWSEWQTRIKLGDFLGLSAKGARSMTKRNLPTGRHSPSVRRMHELLKRLRAESIYR
jgi:hypothetical protein